jgi:ABC-type sugar transport system substrate-binding protein
MDLFGPTGSDRSDAFSESFFEETLRAAADDPTVDGIFASIHGQYIEDAISYAAERKTVVTINSGSDVSPSLNPVGGKLVVHAGMDELLAGKLCAERLSEAGVMHLAVLSSESANSGFQSRFNGANDYLQSISKIATLLDMEADGIDVDNDNEVVPYIESKLAEFSTVDGILILSATYTTAVITALTNAGKDPSTFRAGSFDTNDALAAAMLKLTLAKITFKSNGYGVF